MERTPTLATTASLKKFAIFLISLSIFSGCATTRRTSTLDGTPEFPVNRSAKTSDKEVTEFKRAQEFYAKGRFEETLQALIQFEKKYPKSQFLSQSKNVKGLSYLLTKRAQLALAEFQKAAALEVNPDFKPYTYFNLAAAQYELGQFEEAKTSLSQVFPSRMDKDNRFKVFYLQARVLARVKQPTQAIRDFFAASRLMEVSSNTSLAQSIRTEVEAAARQIEAMPEIEKLYSENEDAPLADTLLFVMGKNDPSKMRLLVERFPASHHYAVALATVRAIQTLPAADSRTIGVLLPLTGKYAEFGQRALQAIQLAFGVWDDAATVKKNGTGFSLVFEDAGEDAQKTLAAFEKLVRNQRPIAVIGPMLSKGAEAITQKAEEYQIPLLTLAQQPGLNSSFAFHFGVTPQSQANALAQYAFEHLQIKRFAIVYPRTKAGELFSFTFWDKIESLGGEVRGVEGFAQGETDFKLPIDRLAGLHYTDARHLELEAMAKQRTEMKITKKTRKTEMYFNLKPIIDFDAVFIADDALIAGQLLPTFAYRDVENVKFLGTSTWNSDQLVQRAGAAAEGSVFPSAFFNDTSDLAVRQFADRYSALYESLPSEVEALAFDTAKVLTIAHGGTATDRLALRSRLASLTGYKGATGTLSYIGDSIVRSLTMLTVKSGKITQASP